MFELSNDQEELCRLRRQRKAFWAKASTWAKAYNMLVEQQEAQGHKQAGVRTRGECMQKQVGEGGWCQAIKGLTHPRWLKLNWLSSSQTLLFLPQCSPAHKEIITHLTGRDLGTRRGPSSPSLVSLESIQLSSFPRQAITISSLDICSGAPPSPVPLHPVSLLPLCLASTPFLPAAQVIHLEHRSNHITCLFVLNSILNDS